MPFVHYHSWYLYSAFQGTLQCIYKKCESFWTEKCLMNEQTRVVMYYMRPQVPSLEANAGDTYTSVFYCMCGACGGG
jgi:surface polysaccharide O-acyltransferase-like enzyme